MAAPSIIKLPAIHRQSTPMKSLFILVACSVPFSIPSGGAETCDARTSEKQILTPVSLLLTVSGPRSLLS